MRKQATRRRSPRGAVAGTFYSMGVGILLLAWLAAPTATPAQECELALEPAQVEVGSESAVVQAIPSEEIGEVDAVSAEDGSGLEIALVPDEALLLEVNAASASEGEWQVTVSRDEEALCSGPLSVVNDGR